MDPITAVAASGMRARMESLDLLANNVANASTGGYKADREFYSLYAGPENAEESDWPSTMPVIERHWTDQSQGVLQTTGNALDVALSGKGFFAVDGPNGPLYTRNGNFHLAADGKLVTPEGYAVHDAANAPLILRGSADIQIATDGTVQQNGAVIGQLGIVDFTSTAGLAKQGNNYFAASTPGAPAADGTVEQGKLEASNSGTADAAVRLVSIMRQFEMMQKAVSLGEDMSRQAIEQVAKVGA